MEKVVHCLMGKFSDKWDDFFFFRCSMVLWEGRLLLKPEVTEVEVAPVFTGSWISWIWAKYDNSQIKNYKKCLEELPSGKLT